MDKLCKSMPKLELHAHISGSVSNETVLKLRKKSMEASTNVSETKYFDSIDDVFHRFSLLHDILKDIDSIQLAVKDVIDEFAADGVVYLELRTTLRNQPTMRNYLFSVLDAIQQAKSVLANKIQVGLLISIDRARGLEHSLDSVRLAIEANKQLPHLVVGMDVSGNPSVANLLDFLPALEMAKAHNLKCSVHLAEIDGKSDETNSFLKQFCPDRIGHGTFILQNDVAETICTSSSSNYVSPALEIVTNQKIPLEICLTSNVKSKTVLNYESHHLQNWLKRGHPVCICTDDKGVFGSDLSNEFALAVAHFGLSPNRLAWLSATALRASFAADDVKRQLAGKLSAFWSTAQATGDDGQGAVVGHLNDKDLAVSFDV